MTVTEFFFSLLSLALTIALPIVIPPLLQRMSANAHGDRVAIWQEAGVNAAGRVAVGMAAWMAANPMMAKSSASVLAELNRLIAKEAAASFLMVPEVAADLGKDREAMAQLVMAKAGAAGILPATIIKEVLP